MASPVPRRLVLAALPMLAGCVVVGPLEESTLASIRRGGTAAVMLRFVVTNEAGEDVRPFSAGMSDDSLGVALGDFDSGGLPEAGRWPARIPSEAAQADGLVVFLLAPGYYYLAIQGARRTDALTYGARYRTVPRWRLAVPAGLANVVALAAGNAHSLALRADGTVVGWGANDQLQPIADASTPEMRPNS